MAEYICPHCKNPVNDDDALLCLFCGESLGRSVGFMGKLRYPRHKIIFIIVIVIVLASFAILMSR
ncbi:MAG: hypothetical protein COV71_06395 [Candidatus Omnitrophica bacterium CG11_big_fil_rev_8_21_14_0_20_41_12]|nr:MAG: hypothetical protein COV71_06395 [Candidatus Omnitrophica bacterium CG11_big_fil_rev_8_21_14_0_20_41_12]